MKRHAFDALSFTFGILFLAVTVMLWGFDLKGNVLEWIGAGALLFIGTSLLLSSRKRSREES